MASESFSLASSVGALQGHSCQAFAPFGTGLMETGRGTGWIHLMKLWFEVLN